MYLLLLLALGAAIWWFISRGRELFCLSIRDGRVLVVRGRVPPRFLGEVRDVIRRDKVARGTIKAVAREDRARLECSSQVPEGTAQRLRNAFALYPVSAVRQAPPIERPTIGQVIGIAWLAWFLESRIRGSSWL